MARPTQAPHEFVDDWNRMIATVSEFSEKWNLPKAEMIFHPTVHSEMNACAQTPLLSTLIHLGVRVRFGRFELGTILKEQ